MSSQSFNSASSSSLLVDGVPGEPGLDGKVHSFPISFHCQKLFNLLSHIKFVVQVVCSLSFGKYELLNVDKPESKFRTTFQGFKMFRKKFIERFSLLKAYQVVPAPMEFQEKTVRLILVNVAKRLLNRH